MEKIRAKFQVQEIRRVSNGETVIMRAVYGSNPDHENKVFSQYTPSGVLEIHISQEAPAFGKFEFGKEYYLDFTKAE